MEHISFRRIFAICIALILSGCATSVGNRTSFEDTKFVVGKTLKQEVATALGLPSEVSNAEGLLLWGYPDSPELVGLIIAVPTGPNVVSTYAIDVTDSEQSFNQAKMIYGFDEDGVLRRVLDQR